MNVIQVAFFIIFVFGGLFIGIHLISNVDWFKHFAGLILGGIVGWVLWVATCSLFERENTNQKEKAILILMRLKLTAYKEKLVEELDALPADSEEVVIWDGIPVQLHTQCEKLEDGKFQLSLSAKFHDDNDTITYSRGFTATR